MYDSWNFLILIIINFVYSMKKYILLFISFSIFSQNFNTTNFDIDSNFNIIKNEVAQAYTKKAINYAGNRYYFKKPKKALLNLFDGDIEKNKFVEKKIEENFDLSPRGIREMLSLNKPIYEKTAAYGHFGRTPESDGAFSWENTDETEVFLK